MQTLAPSWNLGYAATAKWYLRLFPSLNDIAFLLPMVVLFTRMKGTQLLFSDGDTGWHIRTGDWILSHRAIPAVDPFSFSKPNTPWFAWEWGWDVLASLAHQFAGLAGIGFVVTVMLSLCTLLVYRLVLRASQNNVVSIAITALVAAVSSIHWLARPHLVSWIFTLIFLNILESARSNGLISTDLQFRLLRVLLPILMAVWTNLHGGFVAGLLVIGCYAVGETLTSLLQADNPAGPLFGRPVIPFLGVPVLRAAWKSSALYWQSLALCAAATFLNPYGWHLHKHIYTYLSDSDLLDKIQEFQSISFHAGPAIYLELLLLLAAFAVFQNLKAHQLTPVLLICLWAHMALLSARHIPLFAIVAAPFAAVAVASGLDRMRELPALRDVSETFADICHDFRTIELTPRLHVLSAAGLFLIAGLFALGHVPFAPQFNPENFPLQAVPVIESHLGSRVFTTDQWGDYLIYRFYPAQRVFFDGRSDFYGNDFVKVNQRIQSAEHDWKALLQSFSIGIVMLKPETPLSAVLKLTPGARVLFDDGKVIVFDTAGIYLKSSTQVLRSSESANRALASPQTVQPAFRQAALTNRPNKLQKGKTSS